MNGNRDEVLRFSTGEEYTFDQMSEFFALWCKNPEDESIPDTVAGLFNDSRIAGSFR